MTDLKDTYYNNWIEQVKINKELKLKIEEMEKLKEYNSHFDKRTAFLEREIKRVNQKIKNYTTRFNHINIKYSSLSNTFSKIKNALESRLLLGNFEKVSISEKQKDELLTEIREMVLTQLERNKNYKMRFPDDKLV